ncbi:hypothetical protein KAI52_01985, partial [Candidatus Parcubacteria bacterium]|nr:hypothetical protein [Candidatus Parcubacteria bacterium]
MQYILSIDSLITGIVSFVFGIIVLSNNKKSIINQTGFLLTFATAWWAFCYWQWLTVYDDKEIALFWTRMLSIGSTMIPLFYFHWIISLLNLNKQKKRIVILFYIIVLFFLLFSFSPLFIQNVKPINYFSFWPQAGILYTIYLICVYIGLVIYSLCLLFKHYNKSIGLKHTQLKYVIIGSILGFGGGATNFFLWYNINILPLGNFLVILYPILFSYAILRHRLMDITVIIRKTTVYFFTIISYLSIVLFAIYITSSAGNIKVNWIIVWMAFSVAAILLALFDNIKNFFTRLANKYFFSDIV